MNIGFQPDDKGEKITKLVLSVRQSSAERIQF